MLSILAVETRSAYSMSIIPTKYATRISSCEFFINLFMISDTVRPVFEQNFQNCLRTVDYQFDHHAVEPIIATNGILCISPIIKRTYVRSQFYLRNKSFRKLATNKPNVDICIQVLKKPPIEAYAAKIKVSNRNPINLPQNIKDFIEEIKPLRRNYHV